MKARYSVIVLTVPLNPNQSTASLNSGPLLSTQSNEWSSEGLRFS